MKRAFHDRLLIIIALCFTCGLAGYSAGLPQSGLESMSEQATESQGVLQEQRNGVEQLDIPSASDTVTQTPTPKAEHARNVDFRYIHRGFTAVPWNNSEKLKKFSEFRERIIATETEWQVFMDLYCPGIPYDEPWDFSKDYLVAFITEGADPAYIHSNTISSLTWENGHFTPKYDNDSSNYVYALNTSEFTHFYVQVLAISKENQNIVQERKDPSPISNNFKTIYRGFSTVPLDDRDTFEKFQGFGGKIISTEEGWQKFKASFCPGIPFDVSQDFSENVVTATICLGARPMYVGSGIVLGIDPESGFPITEIDLPHPIYALNTGDDDHLCTHFYIELVAVNRADLPANAWNYQLD